MRNAGQATGTTDGSSVTVDRVPPAPFSHVILDADRGLIAGPGDVVSLYLVRSDPSHP